MSPKLKTVLLITFALLLVAVAFSAISSWAAQNPLRTRVTKVIPRGDYTVLRLEVRNESRQSVMLFTRWGVYEAGPRPAGFGISTDSLEDLMPMVLGPGKTYNTGGSVSTASLSRGNPVYYYQWQPPWQAKLEYYWSWVRWKFGRASTSVYLDAQGKLGTAEIEIPRTP
jgi:hypothetical protein